MILSLSLYIVFSVFGLAFQQYAFMQTVRTTPPYRLIENVSNFALYLFVFAWVSGLYYYSAFYESFEQVKIIGGDFPWIHQYFVEPRGMFLALTPIFSFLFLHTYKKHQRTQSKKVFTQSLLLCLCALGFGALNLGIEMLIGGAAN